MLIRSTAAAVACLALVLAASVASAQQKQNQAPAEAEGFAGTLEGAVVAKKANGNTLTINVTKVTAGADSTAKEAEKLVGKEVVVTVRWEKKEGEWKPVAADQKAVKALKKGDAVVLEVGYVDELKVLRLTQPLKKAEDPAAAE